jgi:hypothetical protein
LYYQPQTNNKLDNDSQPYRTETVKMAVKKSKRDANSINSKLALVMKSGKGMCRPIAPR